MRGWIVADHPVGGGVSFQDIQQNCGTEHHAGYRDMDTEFKKHKCGTLDMIINLIVIFRECSRVD